MPRLTPKDNMEICAKILALRHDNGHDAERLEPGDLPTVDGTLPNGDKAHFRWRDFMGLAEDIVIALS